MALYDRKCPACGRIISQAQVPIWQSGGFPCPACGRQLRTSLGDLKVTWAITLCASMAGCFYFGLQGYTALVTALIASVPLSFVVHSALGLVFAHPLEPFPGDPPKK
jgi:hypothetical protein